MIDPGAVAPGFFFLKYLRKEHETYCNSKKEMLQCNMKKYLASLCPDEVTV